MSREGGVGTMRKERKGPHGCHQSPHTRTNPGNRMENREGGEHSTSTISQGSLPTLHKETVSRQYITLQCPPHLVLQIHTPFGPFGNGNNQSTPQDGLPYLTHAYYDTKIQMRREEKRRVLEMYGIVMHQASKACPRMHCPHSIMSTALHSLTPLTVHDLSSRLHACLVV